MDWLTTRPTPDQANHWLALLSLVLFALGVVAAGILSTRPSLPPFNGKYTQKFVMKTCTILGWICGLGMFFGIMRLLQIDPATMGRPIWIVLCWIALVAATGWLISQAPADHEMRKLNDSRVQSRKKAKPAGKSAA